MKLFLFGQIGSGKSYIGQLVGTRFNLHFHDADDDLPMSVRAAIRDHQVISDAMRDEYVDAIVHRIRMLSKSHERFCVAQALFKNRHRQRILLAVPEIRLVWVKSTPELISRRLQDRTGHLASAYYGRVVNPGFEEPTVPHESIENTEDRLELDRRIAVLVAKIRPNQ